MHPLGSTTLKLNLQYFHAKNYFETEIAIQLDDK